MINVIEAGDLKSNRQIALDDSAGRLSLFVCTRKGTLE